MRQVSDRLKTILENNTKMEIFSEVLLEAEVNGYSDFSVDFPQSVEPSMFPAEEVIKTRRPLGGLPKLITPFGNFKSTEINDLCYTKSQNWYRFPSKDSSYKYYRSKKVSSENAPFEFDEPLEFIVNYENTIRLNKLVVGFEYSTALPGPVEIFLYNNESWSSIGTYEPIENGTIVISYDGFWSQSDSYSNSFTTTDKIKLVIDRMKDREGAVEIIQISPRISVDLTERVISASSSDEAQDVNIVSPIGTSLSSSFSIELSNNDGFLNNENQESPIFGLIDINVQFILRNLVGGDGPPFEKIPVGVAFANSWNFTSEGTVTVDCSDRAKFLQSRSIENSFYSEKDIRFIIADIIERAEIVDYKLCFTEEDVQRTAKYFFFQDEKTVWECLQEIAVAEQSFYYFDPEGVFYWISRDYWWGSEEIDYEILSRSKENKLPNLQGYSIQYTNVVNKANIQYSPTEILKQGDRFVNNFLWEQDNPLVLDSTPLLSKISDSSEFFLIDPQNFLAFPEEGIVNIDAEYIRYSTKRRPVTNGLTEIEETLNEFIHKVQFAVTNAAGIEELDEDQVEIVYAQKIVWPDTSIGFREPFRNYSKILVDGFFLIFRVPGDNGGQKFLQYNSSLTRNPFLSAVAVDDTEESYSYWTVVEDGEELQLQFTEASTIFVPPNVLFIEERGLFNSSPVDHNLGVGDGAFVVTQNNTPPEVVVESPRIVFDTVENSNLKLRINTINPDLIHHYYPNRPGNYNVYGAEFVFPIFFDEDLEGFTYDGQGVAGIFINKDGVDSGYYIEFTNSAYARLTLDRKREVLIWKYDENGEKEIMAGFLPEDLFLLSLEEIFEVAGVPVDILPGSPQKVTVFVDPIERFIPDGEDGEGDGEFGGQIINGIRIIVLVNGRRVLAVDDFDVEGNVVYTEGDWGVFARSNTSVNFEYIYAIDRLGDTTLLDKSRFAIRDQINGGFIDNTLEYFLDENNELRNEVIFEDFGSFVREAVEVDVRHEIAPSVSSGIFASNESKIYFINRKLDQFSSKFTIVNRTRDFVVVSGDDFATGTNMVLAVFGVPLNQSESEDFKKVNDRSLWRRGEEEIIIESPWIQNKEKAKQIAEWVVKRWSEPAELIEVEAILDPRVELGDLATISIPENFITPETHKFHVTRIERTVSDANGMSLTLRRAHF